MHLPQKSFKEKQILKKSFFENIAKFIKSIQLKSGAIPSNDDGSHDPWDHIESIMGLNFANEYESSKLAFDWLIKNQNQDGSWFSKYMDDIPIQKNKPTHFAPYISVASLHFYKIFSDKEYLEYLWPSIESAINFSIKLQIQNGTIPWSIDKNKKLKKTSFLQDLHQYLKVLNAELRSQK